MDGSNVVVSPCEAEPRRKALYWASSHDTGKDDTLSTHYMILVKQTFLQFYICVILVKTLYSVMHFVGLRNVFRF